MENSELHIERASEDLPALPQPAKFFNAGYFVGLQYIAPKCATCNRYAPARLGTKKAYNAAIEKSWRVVHLAARPPACNVKRRVRLWQCPECDRKSILREKIMQEYYSSVCSFHEEYMNSVQLLEAEYQRAIYKLQEELSIEIAKLSEE